MTMPITNAEWSEAVQRLRRFQPTATDIKGDTCHCRRKALMLSYLLESDKDTPIRAKPDGTQWEHCGYWCALCDFSNAGSRLIEPSEDEL